MTKVPKTLRRILMVSLSVYVLICGLLYFGQEHLIFFPTKLPADHVFQFEQEFDEISVMTVDSKKLHGLLFKADSSEGVVFFLHGNGGDMDHWGNIAGNYTDHGYDIFMLDYRGYGKSEGRISSEQQFHQDVQSAYDHLKGLYDESEIVILGYSIGSGPATRLASQNDPAMLILQAPYYSLTDLMYHTYKIVPGFILRYKFQTDEVIGSVKAPIHIFHGDADRVIYHGSSIKLKELLKAGDQFTSLPGLGHGGINDNETYQKELKKDLDRLARRRK